MSQIFRDHAEWCRQSAKRTPILEESHGLIREAETLEEMATEILQPE